MQTWLTKISFSEAGEDNVANKIREHLKRSITVQKLCNKFNISPKIIDKLEISFMNLPGEYAETDAKKMKINKDLLKDKNFFEDNMLIFVHELYHNILRTKNLNYKKNVENPANESTSEQQENYFDDPEEVAGFILSISYLIEKGYDMKHIYAKIYPKIEFHFAEKDKAVLFFKKLYQKANRFLHN